MLDTIPTHISGAIKFEFSAKLLDKKLLEANTELAPILNSVVISTQKLLNTATTEIVL
jgi:hypothetical protein